MKKQYHYILMLVTLLLVVGCAILIPRVKVNSDMTEYLPDDSQMKQGIAIIKDSFNTEYLNNASVKVMFEHIDENRRLEIANLLGVREEVNAVSYQVSADSVYTKYDLQVSPTLDQKAFGNTIKKAFGKDVVVETSQDGATPPVSALIIAGALILIILLGMAQSWVEPIIYIFVIGVAVILNIGTNALLPSVSITTNYIVAILQLVLSLDYAIVLSNRYRQERQSDGRLIDSMNRAIKGSSPAIISSAMTTIVGLAMLAFMRVKIGLDLGVVLSKGVLCSLITTFTILPSLLMLCNTWITRTNKKTFVIPTDRLGRFATHHKISLTISALVLLALSFFYSRQTDIYFNTNSESQIEEIFPKTNQMVMIYHTADEDAIIALADSLQQDSSVKTIISYPTLLKKQHTATHLVQYIGQLSQQMSDQMPDADLSMLTPEMMQMVYYMRSHSADTLRISFPDLMQFVKVYCIDNPMFDQVISNDMREQMALLDMMLPDSSDTNEEASAWDEPIAIAPPIVRTPTKGESLSLETAEPNRHTTAVSASTTSTQSDMVDIRSFMPRLYMAIGDDMAHYLMQLTDTNQLDKPMTVSEMADLVGSTMAQTRMVYSFSKNGKMMTPLQYVHFLIDDLFQRKALAKFVSEDQKEGLIARTRLMDAAYTGVSLPAAEVARILAQIGVGNFSKDRVMTIAEPKVTHIAQVNTDEPLHPIVDIQTETETLSQIRVQAPAPKRKNQFSPQPSLFEKLMYGGESYTYEEMTRHFQKLGQDIDTSTVEMLYCYYGSHYGYNDSLSMSLEQMLAYVNDTLVHLDVVAAIIDSSMLSVLSTTQAQLSDAVKMLSHPDYSLMVVLYDLPAESKATYAFIDRVKQLSQSQLQHPSYLVGESVMFSELKDGFADEMTFITLLTILAIFIIVAITFRSIIVPTILVMTVMTAVFVNVVVSGWISGQMLYLAYLIVQSILMGATIDYGILYANYYKENRRKMEKYDAASAAYKGSVRTITTSGLIMVAGPGVMAMLVQDVTIQAIVGCISIGALMAILLILFVLPGVLVAFDKLVVSKKFLNKKN